MFTFIILEQQGGVEAPVHVSSVLPLHVLQGRPRWPPSSLYGFTVRFTKKNIWIKYFILQSNAVSILSFLSVSSKILIRKSPIKTLYLPILQFLAAFTMLWIVTQLTFYYEKILWMIESVEEILSWGEQWAPLLCLCLILFTILGISFTFHIQIRSKLNFRYIYFQKFLLQFLQAFVINCILQIKEAKKKCWILIYFNFSPWNSAN